MQQIPGFFPNPGQVQPINVVTGKGSLIEIINPTLFNLRLDLANQGAAGIFSQTQSIWPLVSETQGQQMIQITPSKSLNQASYSFSNLLEQNTEAVLINVYQAGEIQWYPPFALAAVESLASTAYATSQASGTTLSLIIPSPPPLQFTHTYIVLAGFDLTIGPGATAGAATMTIGPVSTGLTSTNLTFRVANSATAMVTLQKTYTPGVLGIADTAMTLTLGAVGNSVLQANLTWYEFYI